MIEYHFSKELYSKEALLKAAYSFTDMAYLHLDADERNYYVRIEAKEGSPIVTEQEFQNRLLSEMVRLCVSERTKNVRELVLARAFSSTIIEGTDMEQPPENNFDIESILKDWFETNDSDKAE